MYYTMETTAVSLSMKSSLLAAMKQHCSIVFKKNDLDGMNYRQIRRERM